MKLRPYQLETLDAIQQSFKEFKRVLVVSPTGSGKTISFAKLAERQAPGRTLILAHRDELIDQAIAKIRTATGIRAGKEKAENKASSKDTVVVASIQTMVRRLDRWPSDHFDLVVTDEAHHAISESWRKVLDHFAEANVLGVTATPDRGDKRTLGEYFEAIAYEVSLVRLIHEKFLCPITIKCVPLKIDLNQVHVTAGDFNDAELGHALEPYLGQIAEAIAEYAPHRRTLAFLPLIDTSHKFVDACVQAGINARHIDGKSKDRKEILGDFASGRFDLLSNAMLLTEGYDCPDIDCIVVLRCTKSRPLFAQMVGRGTRIAPFKPNLMLLDFLWLHERHRIVHPADLIAQTPEEADDITDLAKGKSLMGADEDELDLMELARDVAAEREEKLRKRLAEVAQRAEKFVSAEQFCVDNNATQTAFFEETMTWEHKGITDGQRKYLEKAGINMDTVRGRGHASALLDIYFKKMDLELASPKQRYVMGIHGHPNAKKATRKEAKEFFNELNARKSNNLANEVESH